ncbi:probable cytochrome P450 9f2 [Phymastichus coffea]|uniref:probable cytochrome P450 9f2 n=1 Tax=Phymastichus coffea TaxID=108790 RepID=UPI00273CE3B2|nr:probable cytochrome P450 9f2 [Phymastichus coffea]
MVYLSVLLLIAIVFIIRYIYVKLPYDYFKKQGVETINSFIPFFGHTMSVLCFWESLSDICINLYKKSKSSMIGMFHLTTPVLIICEPELIKTVQIKDFSSFRNNITSLDEERDPFTAVHPFFAVDERWKESRTLFASGMSSKKLKIMFEAMHRVSQKFGTYLENLENEVDLKKLSMHFTNEIVCNAGFGIEYNQTYATMAGKIFEYTWANEFKQLFNFYLPKAAKILQLNFETAEIRQYFGAVAKSIVENEKGDDFVRMTMETLGEMNLKTATTLISSFYIDASGTVATAISMALFRLSKNWNVQEKLRNEIHETLYKYEGKLTYEALQDMTYLQQVIYETLRLHPILEINSKICTETTTLVGSDGLKCTLQPGNIVVLPILGFHKDEKYWRDPETFNPDRFADDNKESITKFTFTPFGEGPRQCPGMRFGLIEAKIVLITILRQYKVVSSDKVNFPLEMDTRNTLRAAKETLWAHLVPI